MTLYVVQQTGAANLVGTQRSAIRGPQLHLGVGAVRSRRYQRLRKVVLVEPLCDRHELQHLDECFGGTDAGQGERQSGRGVCRWRCTREM